MKPFFFLIIVLQVFCTCSPVLSTQEDKKPNILFILVDDLGKEWISCYGAEDIETPHIDALAKSGIKFNNVWSMPQCTPTRLTLLTGQYPFRHGWVNHWDVPRWGGGCHFDETLNPTLTKALKVAGYRTAVAGKWQIDDFRVEPDALTKTGFDEYCVWTGYETGVPASANRYQDPYLYTKDGSKTYPGEFGPDLFKQFLLEFMEENRDTSFFIYFPMVLTHTPFVNPPNEEAPDKLGKHKAMVRYTDKIAGELINALEKLSLRENTVIIWTTDNGTTGQVTGKLESRSIQGGKAKLSEAGINSPFIISWPSKVKPNQTSNALIDFSDILPTCLDLAGHPIDSNRYQNQHIDGKSFKKVLFDPGDHSNRDWILSMGGGNDARLTNKGVENQFKFRDRVIRNQGYKLYIDSHRQPSHFFDLQNDPAEKNNLIAHADSPELKSNLEYLGSWIRIFPTQDEDPRYKPNPEQEWDVPITAESEIWKQ